MWLSEELARRTHRGAAEAESGTVTVEAESAGVYARGEVRGAVMASPGGYLWRPAQGETVLLLRGGARDTPPYVIGKAEQDAQELLPGEVCIRSAGGARIVLRNDGRIELYGSVTLNGVPLNGGSDGA